MAPAAVLSIRQDVDSCAPSSAGGSSAGGNNVVSGCTQRIAFIGLEIKGIAPRASDV